MATEPNDDRIDLIALAIIEQFELDRFSIDDNISKLLEEDAPVSELTYQLLDSLDPVLSQLQKMKSDVQELQDVFLPYYDPAIGAAMQAMIENPIKMINSKLGRSIFRDSLDIYATGCKFVDYGLAAIIKGAVSDKRMFKVEETEVDGKRQLESKLSLDKLTLITWVESVIDARQQSLLHRIHTAATHLIAQAERDELVHLMS